MRRLAFPIGIVAAAGLVSALASCTPVREGGSAADARERPVPSRVEPLDIPVAVPADSSPYVLQTAPVDKPFIIGEQVEPIPSGAADTPPAFERPTPRSFGTSSTANSDSDDGPAALIPAPAADPHDPGVVVRRIGTGGRGSPDDPTSQIVRRVIPGQPVPIGGSPPASGGFIVTGPTVGGVGTVGGTAPPPAQPQQ